MRAYGPNVLTKKGARRRRVPCAIDQLSMKWSRGYCISIIIKEDESSNYFETIVDFFNGMYDILEAHRWAVTEHKLLHHDISPSNIIVEVQDTPNIQEFSNRKRPIFINEVLHGKPAPPIARLLDMDNGANLDTSKVKLRRGTASDEPLRNHTCTSTKMRGKRGSNSIEGQTQSAPKRLRKTGNNEERAPKDTSE
ncbi:hypothetical protein AB1N83_013816 [Pleurotus pulmonarius]